MNEQEKARASAPKFIQRRGGARLQQPADARPSPAAHAHAARAEMARPGGGAQGVIAAPPEPKPTGAPPPEFPAAIKRRNPAQAGQTGGKNKFGGMGTNCYNPPKSALFSATTFLPPTRQGKQENPITKKKQPTAFISHAGIDKERFARPFAAALREKHEVDAWVDEWEIKAGEKFAEKIFAAIGGADAVVVVLSENSVDSKWVREEIDAALVRRINEGAKLLPVVLDKLSNERIPIALRSIQQVRVGADDHALAAEEINRVMRGIPNPRKPPLGSASEQEFAMPESPPPTLSLAVLRQIAAESAIAQLHLGVMYHEGEGVPQDFAEAAKWTLRAAEQGVAAAQFNLGVMHANGRGVPQNDAEAAKWFRRAAEQGVLAAQYNLGVVYDKGEGVPRDDAEATKWFRRAAEQGVAEAQHNLGVAYGKGKGVPQDDAEAAKWFRRAAEQEVAKAQFNLGWMYRNGEGVPQDDTEAVKWYRRAAEQEYAEAQFNLGAMCYEGEGAPRDYAEAAKWWRLAAEQGYARAQSNLGGMYFKGQGVPQDYAKAAKWIRRAVEQGDADAQFNLGVMYHKGKGVPQDFAEAAKWWRLAAEQGYAEAKTALELLQKGGGGKK